MKKPDQPASRWGIFIPCDSKKDAERIREYMGSSYFRHEIDYDNTVVIRRPKQKIEP